MVVNPQGEELRMRPQVFNAGDGRCKVVTLAQLEVAMHSLDGAAGTSLTSRNGSGSDSSGSGSDSDSGPGFSGTSGRAGQGSNPAAPSTLELHKLS